MQLLQRFLLRLPPEVAHHLVIEALKIAQWFWFKVFRVRWTRSPNIHIPQLPKLQFSSRVGLAAGFDKNAEVFAALSQFGFSFFEVGTVTPQPQTGNPKPRLWRFPDDSLVNSMGFNNCGAEQFRRNLKRYRRFVSGIPLFANIGKNKDTPNGRALEDYLENIRYCSGGWVDGFVVNLSSPNTPGLRDLQSEAFLEKLAGILPPELPAFVKLSPDLEDADLVKLCAQVARTERYSGLVLTNTSRKLAESLSPVGGLSGSPLAERALKCVALAREQLPAGKLIIASGGITSVSAGKAMRAAGADLIEVYTGFVYHGPKLVWALREALRD